ncbi:hypothetical protein CXG81DRAFT_16261 [Caulochytrium protostelioides]|uniref:RNI-like protein n=2 Tax=Caulochytrium protostelioides TaxID=1555241 RepID=A0A4P9XGC0_9FUNG|nr:hypothetical protein CXG81DRAFT_16261 [Caulochytrium protostelioides]|eukprot:RKP04281.1 hypothetical protein CXG81DRAFT_16261 [Caulochytrium protostelioides]
MSSEADSPEALEKGSAAGSIHGRQDGAGSDSGVQVQDTEHEHEAAEGPALADTDDEAGTKAVADADQADDDESRRQAASDEAHHEFHEEQAEAEQAEAQQAEAEQAAEPDVVSPTSASAHEAPVAAVETDAPAAAAVTEPADQAEPEAAEPAEAHPVEIVAQQLSPEQPQAVAMPHALDTTVDEPVIEHSSAILQHQEWVDESQPPGIASPVEPAAVAAAVAAAAAASSAAASPPTSAVGSRHGSRRGSTSSSRADMSAARATPSQRTAASGPPVPTSAIVAPVRQTNPVLDELLHALQLLEQNDPTLVELDLRDCRVLSPAHGIALGRSLGHNTCLKRLVLANTGLGTDAAKEIAEALRSNATLELLDLERNQIAPQGIKALAEMVGKNTGLRELRLGGQRQKSGTDAEQSLTRSMLDNTTLQKISLQIADVASRNACDRYITRNKEIARKARLAAA